MQGFEKRCDQCFAAWCLGLSCNTFLLDAHQGAKANEEARAMAAWGDGATLPNDNGFAAPLAKAEVSPQMHDDTSPQMNQDASTQVKAAMGVPTQVNATMDAPTQMPKECRCPQDDEVAALNNYWTEVFNHQWDMERYVEFQWFCVRFGIYSGD